ncbi:hypothetical protein E2P81_ATG02024 [Venturia nashicola]|uniref:Uncharacterized protein n=1 Tax=Venturia nashicola TaxID=86259 RepID=A0A4Z1P2F0_9PEZI|nr:hypothetical protein E6O75_ATG02067 [Venturia nashicola]TLD35721.1 hypothetical protein E2P81_ATG02024 [Venturia nashicola]
MFKFHLQAARITKRKAWKRSKGGRLQSRPHRPPPLKQILLQKKEGVHLSPHYLPTVDTPDIQNPSHHLSPQRLPNSSLHTLEKSFHPSMLHHSPTCIPCIRRLDTDIRLCSISLGRIRWRDRGGCWASGRKKRNPRLMEFVNSASLLTKTGTYVDNLVCEERARVSRAMEEVRGLGGDVWRGRWCAGFGKGEGGMVGLVKEDVYVYEGDLVLRGDFWEMKRRVVLKCAVLEELICLAQEIEGVVRDVKGAGKEYGEDWYQRFWRERTF